MRPRQKCRGKQGPDNEDLHSNYWIGFNEAAAEMPRKTARLNCQ